MIASQTELEQRIANAEARELALRTGDPDAMERIAQDDAADAGLAGRAGDAAHNAAGFVRKHPLAIAGGALALGVLIACLLPNSPVRKAGKTLGSKAIERGSRLSGPAGQFALAFGVHLLDVLREARGTRPGKFSGAAAHAGEAAMRAAREAGRKIAGAVKP